MRKIDAEILICSSEQSQQLVALGILPASCFCYEWYEGGQAAKGWWEFGGEYVGQEIVLPAWTYDELCILIGGDIPKPELFKEKDWSMTANMMQWALMLPKKRINYPSGAMATAALLEWLLVNKHVSPDEANSRLDAFVSKEHYNPPAEELKKMEKE